MKKGLVCILVLSTMAATASCSKKSDKLVEKQKESIKYQTDHTDEFFSQDRKLNVKQTPYFLVKTFPQKELGQSVVIHRQQLLFHQMMTRTQIDAGATQITNIVLSKPKAIQLKR